MPNNDTPLTDQKRRRNDQKRLESWKAIANYLNRSVRTARRWEAHEGLPVHRHQYVKGNSVYAFCAELDAWRNKHCEPLLVEPKITPKSKRSSLFSTLARYTAVAIIAIFVGKTLFQTDPGRYAPGTGNSTWLLIADPDNHAGLEEIGGNLVTTLRRQVSRLGNHQVLPLKRVQDILRLMQKNKKSMLDSAIAREVALRDGQVSALIIPHIEKMGESYVVSLEVTDPHNNLLITYPSETVNSISAVLPVFERLAGNIDYELTQRKSYTPPKPLNPVTTSSLLALRHYSKAYELLTERRPMAAQVLLTQAIREDPEFASAKMLQAWALRQGGAKRETYLPISKAAVEISDQVSAAEQFFINGSERYFSGDLIRANANYQALLEIQSDHIFGTQVMLELCSSSERKAECIDHNVRLAKLRPGDFEANQQAAWSLARDADNTRLAAYFADRSLEILDKEYNEFASSSVAQALYFPVITAWAEGNLQDALQKSRQLRANLPMLPVETRNQLIQHLVEFSLIIGRIKDAKNLLQLLSDPEQRYELNVGILFAAGDKKGLKEHLITGRYYKQMLTTLFMSMSGLTNDAMESHGNFKLERLSATQDAVLLASKDFGAGYFDSAKIQLQTAVADPTAAGQAYYFIGADLLSTIFKSEGDLMKAVSVLEKTMPLRNKAAYNHAGIFWLKCQRQLARLYREAGREHDAIRIEEDLRKMLILADDNFSMYRS